MCSNESAVLLELRTNDQLSSGYIVLKTPSAFLTCSMPSSFLPKKPIPWQLFMTYSLEVVLWDCERCWFAALPIGIYRFCDPGKSLRGRNISSPHTLSSPRRQG